MLAAEGHAGLVAIAHEGEGVDGAEEVAAVYPELVTRTPAGDVQTVRYDGLIPLLLNEFQRLHAEWADERQRLHAELAELRAIVLLQRTPGSVSESSVQNPIATVGVRDPRAK